MFLPLPLPDCLINSLANIPRLQVQVCATPYCGNVISEPPDTGRFCSECVLERDLYDRTDRWKHVSTDQNDCFPPAIPPMRKERLKQLF